MFRFKQFSILQNKSAMKIGTDGVLLGAWCPLNNVSKILDIGTGTGLLSLMLAQRSSETFIDAVEIDESAAQEAAQNFKNSKWSSRLQIFSMPLQQMQIVNKYDLIVCNPPYYTDTYQANNAERTLARHVGQLSFQELLKITSNFLATNGTCAFIIPYKEEGGFIKLAEKEGLYIAKITRVKGREQVAIKRSLLYFTKKTPQVCKVNELVIEIERHQYTTDYINLTKEFYLKM